MKRIVFDNWLLMAVATSRAFFAFDHWTKLSLLISGEDFFGATISTHASARRPMIDWQYLRLEIRYRLPTCSSSNNHTLYLLSRSIYERTNDKRTNEQTNEMRGAMNLTKLSKAQREHTRVIPIHKNTSRRKLLKFCIA